MPQQQIQALAPETAFATVHNRVYAPVFFTKVARDYGPALQRCGVDLSNPQHQQQCLTMAAQLRTAHDAHVKNAAAHGSLLDAASQHLQTALNKAGFEFPDNQDALIKQAADEVSRDPEMAHAVLSLQYAAAQAAA